MILLNTENLLKTYNQGEKVIYAVNDVRLRIEEGEFVAITGPSGSGKSTLIQLLAALQAPSGGKIYYKGNDLTAYTSEKLALYRRRDIGFIHQNYNLMKMFTARENIVMPALLDNNQPSKSYFLELVHMLDIANRLEHIPSELSGGQQQRVAVARALINKPKIVFADEPTGNLDKKSSEELIELLLKTRETFGQTLIIVTHDISIANRADKIYNIIDGVLSLLR